MTEGVETGYASITRYEIFWDQGLGTNTFVSLGNTSSNFFEVTSGVSSGINYIFKLLPHNAYGAGTTYSPEFTIQASVPPSKMASISTSMQGTMVRFSWSLPTLGSGSVDKY